MKLILSLVALAVLAMFSLASGDTEARPIQLTQDSNIALASPESADSASLDSEGIESDADSASCLPSGAGCSTRNDNCCVACQPKIGGVLGTCL